METQMITAGKPAMRHDMTPDMRAALDACDACRMQALVALAHCEESGGALAEPSLLQVLHDCIVTCGATSDLIVRGSPHHARLAEVGAIVAEACERACYAAGQESTLRRCAELCAECASTCRQLGAESLRLFDSQSPTTCPPSARCARPF